MKLGAHLSMKLPRLFIQSMFGFKETLVASETRIASTYIRGISEVISQISLVTSKDNY
jgi:hypothetical protein